MRGITGFLLYNGRNFLQLIEGETADLMALMTRLAIDRRHTGIVTLEDRPIDARAFPQWAMRMLPLSDGIAERREAISTAIGTVLEPEVRRTVLNFAALN